MSIYTRCVCQSRVLHNYSSCCAEQHETDAAFQHRAANGQVRAIIGFEAPDLIDTGAPNQRPDWFQCKANAFRAVHFKSPDRQTDQTLPAFVLTRLVLLRDLSVSLVGSVPVRPRKTTLADNL